MKKILMTLLLALGLVFVSSACGSAAPAATTPTPAPLQEGVIAGGQLVPNQSAYLAFQASGRVEQVLVQKGEQVSRGQVLARLGDRQQVEAALAAAQAQAEAARQTRDLLVRTADLAHAQAWQSYLNAQAARAAAQLAWDRLDLESLQTDIDNALADATSRQTELEDAQTELDKYSNLPAENATRKSYQDKLHTAQVNYDSAVQKAILLSNRRDALHAGLEFALAAETEARRLYENTGSGPDPDPLALAQSQLEAADAQLAGVQSTLDEYDLKAPFAGTVADINVSATQRVGPQTWVVALADTSQWTVDTTDLTEMDAVRVSIGQVVQVTADALPGESMTGVVESLSTAPRVQAGDVLYTAHIHLNDPLPGLLWGMTMEVIFPP
jgi:multidrug resistance efflux pump